VNRLTRLAVVLGAVGGSLAGGSAWSSTLLDSFVCEWAGCAVVQHARGSAVYLLNNPPGVEAGLWWQVSALADDEEVSAPLGIDLDGDGTPELSVRDIGASGELDAGDSLQPFQVGSRASVEFASYIEHRLLLAGNQPFSLYADARVSHARGDGPAGLERITQQVRVSSSGRSGQGGYDFSILPSPIQRLLSGPVKILEFYGASRQFPASRLEEQGVEAIVYYSMDRFDLSAGPGKIELEVEYRIFR
jgi:hypothetical protein